MPTSVALGALGLDIRAERKLRDGNLGLWAGACATRNARPL